MKFVEILLKYLISLVKLFFITPTIKFLSFLNKSISMMQRNIYCLVACLSRNTLKVNSSDNHQKTTCLCHKSVQYSRAKTEML
jgi:hypothetical protein